MSLLRNIVHVHSTENILSLSFQRRLSFSSFLLEVVVRLYLVIVNSDCSHNCCMLHIAKTGYLAIIFENGFHEFSFFGTD